MARVMRVAALVLAVLALTTAAASAATRQVRLRGETVPALATGLAHGRLHAVPAARGEQNASLTLTVTLRRSHQAAFQRYLTAVENPRSASFRHFLSQRVLTQRFGPSQAAYRSMLTWLRSEGFRLVQGSADRMTLTVRGSESRVQRAFGVTLRTYATRAGKRVYVNTGDPELPARLAGSVQAISGLSSLGAPTAAPRILALARALLKVCTTLQQITVYNASPAGANKPVLPGLPNGSQCVKWAMDANLFHIWDPGAVNFIRANAAHPDDLGLTEPKAAHPHASGFPGAGQKIGLLEFDTFHTSDVANFLAASDIYAGTINNLSEVNVNGGVSTPGAGESEVLLDADIALSDAPGAQVVVYDAPASTSFESIFNAMISDGDTVISNSWSSCEDQVSQAEADAINSILANAAASGISVLNGSGDTGSTCLDGSANTVGVPADSPNATSVGGTSSQPGPNGIYGSETYWNGATASPQTGAGGYGVSRYFSRPSYQNGLTSATGRSVPDIALNADPADGYAICQADSGGCPDGLQYGGTSASTPLMAAFTADLNQLQGSNLGLLNPLIYPYANTSAFHSAASMGSDFAHVGLGSPNVDQLSLDLRHQTAGAVSANTSYVSDSATSQVPADGSTPDQIVVFLEDANGIPISGKTVSLTASGSATVTPVNAVSSVNNGTAVFDVTDSTAETVTLTATDTTDGVALTPVPITFAQPAATGALIQAEQTDPADATVTVFLQNAQGRPAVDKTVSLAQTGTGTISPAGAEATTDTNGDATFTVNDTNAETDTFTATDVSDGNLPVPGTAQVNFNSTSASCDPGAPGPVSPYTVSSWATGAPFNANAFYVSGVYFGPCDGIGSPVFDASGNAYAADGENGLIYKLGPSGGPITASEALPDANFYGDSLGSIAIDKNGNLYAALAADGGSFGDPEIVQLDPTTGAIERVIADESTGLGQCPAEMAVDPISGNLFITDYCTFGNTDDLEEIVDPSGTNPTVVSDYASLPSTGGVGSAGIAIDPAGTIYLAVPGSADPVVSVSGTSSATPGTVTPLDTTDTNVVGVSVAATDSHGNATSLYLATGNYGFTQGQEGEILRLDNLSSPPQAGTVIAGPRSEALGGMSEGPNGCTYVGASDVVFELADGGSCTVASTPQPTLDLTSSSSAPAPVGSTVTYTATLSNVSGASGTPILFSVGGANAQVKLVAANAAGVATFTETGALSGLDSVHATAVDQSVGSGDALASSALSQQWLTGTGAKDVTLLDLDTSQQGGSPGTPATLSATLWDISQSPAVALSGQTVTLSLDGQTCTAQTTGAGLASCQVTPVDSGVLTQKASYAGSASYLPATAQNEFTSALGVAPSSPGGGTGTPGGGGTPSTGGSGTPAGTAPAATKSTLKVSVLRPVSGQRITLTAAVAPAPSGGTVAFLRGGKPISTCKAVTVVAGVARCSVVVETAGRVVFETTYGGSNGYLTSHSSVASVKVSWSLALKKAAPKTATRSFSLSLKCALLSGGCKVRATLEISAKATLKKLKLKKAKVLKVVDLTIKAGKSGTLKVVLTDADRALVARLGHKAPAQLLLSLDEAGVRHVAITRTITLK